MSILKKLERIIYEIPTWQFVFLVIAIAFLKSGIGIYPAMPFYKSVILNPFIAKDSYLFMSWLGSFLAWLIGVKHYNSLIKLYFIFSLAFTFLFIRIAFVNLSKEMARSSIVLFTILPISSLAYYWIGYDSITLFLIMLALAYPRYAIVTLVIGVCLGMQHFEESILAAAGLTLAILLNKFSGSALKYSLKFCFLWCLGIVIGKLVLMGIFWHYDIFIENGRGDALKNTLHIYWYEFFYNFYTIIYSVLGLGWLVALRYAECKKLAIPFFVPLFGLLLMLPMVADQTRVLAVLIFPLIFVYWLSNPGFLEKLFKHEISLLFLLWMLLPWSWVWMGELQKSHFSFNVGYAVNEFFGTDMPTNRRELSRKIHPG